MENKKYSGYNENDTKLDSYHKSTGQMTNREFFSSNEKGGFYEGMNWDGDDWVLNKENREREASYKATLCEGCGCSSCHCW